MKTYIKPYTKTIELQPCGTLAMSANDKGGSGNIYNTGATGAAMTRRMWLEDEED